MTTPRRVDHLVVGGGLFGIYAALTFARRGRSVMLLERADRLYAGASLVNQARLHLGYHYPRSVATARLSLDHHQRFYDEHRAFINDAFDHFYAVDRFASFTDAAQFERFCRMLAVPAQRVTAEPPLQDSRLQAVFRTREPSFDPFLMRQHYLGRLAASDVQVLTGTTVASAEREGDHWLAQLTGAAEGTVRADVVVNATYDAVNAVNAAFGVRQLEVTHEYSEVVMLHSAALQGLGLTVMDGPFCSVMPYGSTGFHSLTSVLYTHHSFSRNERDPGGTSQAVADGARRSNSRKMLAQVRQYLADDVDLAVRGSLTTYKTKLASSAVDDSRPTEISLLSSDPPFYCLFSGKINSIYEIEKMIVDA